MRKTEFMFLLLFFLLLSPDLTKQKKEREQREQNSKEKEREEEEGNCEEGGGTVSCGARYGVDNCPSFCCLSSSSDGDSCFVPSLPSYTVVSKKNMKWNLEPSDSDFVLFGSPAPLTVEVEGINTELLHIKIKNANANSYEIPSTVIPRPSPKFTNGLSDTVFTVETPSTGEDFYLNVFSEFNGTKRSIFPMDQIYWSNESQYIQFSVSVSDSVSDNNAQTVRTYGLGENSQLTHAMPLGQRRSLWNSDVASLNLYSSLYGSHPLYYQMFEGDGEIDGQTHGVLLLNSNAMDVSLASDNSLLTFQLSGGIIDLYIASGPTPTKVNSQFFSILGLPAVPPYWSLGFHNSRYGYENIEEVESIVNSYIDAQIPFDTQWLDIDYMDQWRDFTYDPVNFPASQVSNFVDQLTQSGRQYVPIIDPGILVPNAAAGQNTTYSPLSDGLNMGVFVQNGDYPQSPALDNDYSQYYVTQVWPGATLSPDWFNPNATSYWTQQLQGFYDLAKYRGLWIDMNEFANFCTKNEGRDMAGQICTIPDALCPDPAFQTTCCLDCQTVDPSNSYDFSPFLPHGYYQAMNGSGLGAGTIAASARHYGGSQNIEYNVHNLYGLMESKATREAVLKIVDERPFILSRSTFVTSPVYTFHWTGDNFADWQNLKISIVTVDTFSLFGMGMIGADMCGFLGNTTEELCNRWVSVAAFHPFSRNHNNIGQSPQELYLWDSVTEASRRALGIKYQLLPWLYSLLALHSLGRSPPTIQALWQSFPQDSICRTIDTQFTWGGRLMLSPVVDQFQTIVKGCFPEGIWYDYQAYSGDPFPGGDISSPFGYNSTGQFFDLFTPLNYTNVFVFEDTAFVRHKEVYDDNGDAYTTNDLLQRAEYEVIVALNSNGNAQGFWLLDDGIQTDITPGKKGNTAIYQILAEDQSVTMTPIAGYKTNLKFNVTCLEAWYPTTDTSDLSESDGVSGCFSTHHASASTSDGTLVGTYFYSDDYLWTRLSLCLAEEKEIDADHKIVFSWKNSKQCDKLGSSGFWEGLSVWEQILFIVVAVIIIIVCVVIIIFSFSILFSFNPEKSYDQIN